MTVTSAGVVAGLVLGPALGLGGAALAVASRMAGDSEFADDAATVAWAGGRNEPVHHPRRGRRPRGRLPSGR